MLFFIEISPHMLKFGSSLSILRGKIIFTKNQNTKQPALRDMLRHFHGLYSRRPWPSTNQLARIRSVIVKQRLFTTNHLSFPTASPDDIDYFINFVINKKTLWKRLMVTLDNEKTLGTRFSFHFTF